MVDTVSSRQSKAKKRPGGATTTASRRAPTAAKRTGGGPADRKAGTKTGAKRTTSPKAKAAKTGRRSAFADAREYAYKPYVDKLAKSAPSDRGSTDAGAAPGGTGPGGSKPNYKELRKQNRARRKEALMTPGAPAVVRGGWPGFLVLLFGELVTIPFDPSGILLYWVALIAYAVAGNRGATPSGTDTKRAVRDGALAAVFAFALTMPLRVSADIHNVNLAPWAIFIQVAAALVVGGLAALIAARARTKAGRTASSGA